MRNGPATITWAVLAALATMISGCSSVPSSGLASQSHGAALGDQFKTGEARLGCRWHCALTWGLYRNEANVLYKAQAWNDLALNVLRIGYADDLSYFYLGKAAEGL